MYVEDNIKTHIREIGLYYGVDSSGL
jgi:hypothetical protein